MWYISAYTGYTGHDETTYGVSESVKRVVVVGDALAGVAAADVDG